MKKVIILMGVSGCGKTSVGTMLANTLGVPFYDGDDFHTKSNVIKMKNGLPLNDQDRQPWLNVLAQQIKKWSKKGGAVLACSALKERYRISLMRDTDNVDWIVLVGSYDMIKQRMLNRSTHYMKSDMLQSQFDILELPSYGHTITIDQSIDCIVDEIILKLKSS